VVHAVLADPDHGRTLHCIVRWVISRTTSAPAG